MLFFSLFFFISRTYNIPVNKLCSKCSHNSHSCFHLSLHAKAAFLATPMVACLMQLPQKYHISHWRQQHSPGHLIHLNDGCYNKFNNNFRKKEKITQLDKFLHTCVHQMDARFPIWNLNNSRKYGTPFQLKFLR